MNTPRKHAEIIKAWADGHKIQWRVSDRTSWNDFNDKSDSVSWYPHYQFRIKPELKSAGEVCAEAYMRTPLGDNFWEHAAKAVIEAYKAGEIKE